MTPVQAYSDDSACTVSFSYDTSGHGQLEVTLKVVGNVSTHFRQTVCCWPASNSNPGQFLDNSLVTVL